MDTPIGAVTLIWVDLSMPRQVLEVDLLSAPLMLTLCELHGQGFDFAQLGGHARWFEIRDVSVATLTALDARASA